MFQVDFSQSVSSRFVQFYYIKLGFILLRGSSNFLKVLCSKFNIVQCRELAWNATISGIITPCWKIWEIAHTMIGPTLLETCTHLGISKFSRLYYKVSNKSTCMLHCNSKFSNLYSYWRLYAHWYLQILQPVLLL